VFLLFGIIFRIIGLSGLIGKVAGFVAFLLALFVAWAVKKAFIDSYILVSTMTSYMEVAPTTVITFDLYNKLCGISSKFKELFNKGKEESPESAYAPAYATAGTAAAVGTGTQQAQLTGKPVFCGECGAQNDRGTKFCGNCGKPL
jgi:hypothetical protein